MYYHRHAVDNTVFPEARTPQGRLLAPRLVRRVLAELAGHANAGDQQPAAKDWAWPTIRTLARESECSVVSVKRVLQWARAAGFFAQVQAVVESKSKKATRYKFREVVEHDNRRAFEFPDASIFNTPQLTGGQDSAHLEPALVSPGTRASAHDELGPRLTVSDKSLPYQANQVNPVREASQSETAALAGAGSHEPKTRTRHKSDSPVTPDTARPSEALLLAMKFWEYLGSPAKFRPVSWEEGFSELLQGSSDLDYALYRVFVNADDDLYKRWRERLMRAQFPLAYLKKVLPHIEADLRAELACWYAQRARSEAAAMPL